MELIGEAPPFLACLELLAQVSKFDVPVLILGETGTGKELVARSAHYQSPRAEHGFVPVNCGAMPEDLFANEVFGHRRGAFTGADSDCAGLISRAEGGTLFLDEIDSMGPRGQVALLRFLQDNTFRRLGAGREKVADVRVVAAANVDLRALAGNGRFREDLLYRLDVVRIDLPPLRERKGDVLLLARHFFRRFAELYDWPAPKLDPALVTWLTEQPWPGNVRELENALHRLFLTCGTADGAIAQIPEPKHERRPVGAFNAERARVVNAFERQYLTCLLKDVGGNISEAARRAGKERSAFKRLIKKHDLNRADFASPSNDHVG